MTRADERAREHAAIQDDREQLAIANAGLLVEVAELTATVEAVRAERENFRSALQLLVYGGLSHGVMSAVLRRLDLVEGL